MHYTKLKFDVQTIPHHEQRYDTCGDWWWDDDTLHIRVSDLGDAFMEFFVASHEMTEAMGCLKDGVTEEIVTEFDKRFEVNRKMGIHSANAEPGDHRAAPYRKWHRFATKLEKKQCKAFGIGWKEYDKKINSL